MQNSWYRSPQTAVTLVCACTLVSLYLFQRGNWQEQATREPRAEECYTAKYERLRSLMPTDEVTRFVIDEDHADLKRLNPDARLFLAQYTVSPRRLAREATSRWIVVDSDQSDVEPEMAKSAHWTLIADLRNGVRFYRTDVGED